MNKTIALASVAALIAIGGYVFWPVNPNTGTEKTAQTTPPKQGDPIVADIRLPASFTPQEEMGKRAFNTVCAACHGKNGGGRQGMGPPFISPIYRPGHHGDYAFEMAVKNGVQPHHWTFGSMPPQPGLTRADVLSIVSYVRAIQRENGIR